MTGLMRRAWCDGFIGPRPRIRLLNMDTPETVKGTTLVPHMGPEDLFD